MWNRKLCLSANENYGLPMAELIKQIHKVGFDAFFPTWNEHPPIDEWAKTAKEENIIIQSVHAPYYIVDAMWKNDDRTQKALSDLLDCLEDCARYEVPIMVTHAFIGFNEHTPTDIGIENFGKLIKKAEEYGIKIAFENTEGEEYLAALMKAFDKSKALGFCWDSGHELCYNHSKDLLGMYGNHLVATHINDNLGIKDYNGNITCVDDLHLLPYDGIADWDYNIKRLKNAGYDGILTFELKKRSIPERHENDKYVAMSTEEYLTECYIRACKIAYKFMNL